jgi:hypothetical protein
MKAIQPYSLANYLSTLRDRQEAGLVRDRELQTIDRMTDEQIATVDIRAVLGCIWLQHNQTPIREIPVLWWDEVMRGAKIK